MNFKSWLKEWEGNSFNQDTDYFNTENWPVDSKYRGKTKRSLEDKKKREEENDEDEDMLPDTPVDKIEKEFGFTKKDMELYLRNKDKKIVSGE